MYNKIATYLADRISRNQADSLGTSNVLQAFSVPGSFAVAFRTVMSGGEHRRKDTLISAVVIDNLL